MLRFMTRATRDAEALGFFDCFRVNHLLSKNRQLLANPRVYLGLESLADVYFSVDSEGVSIELKCFVPFLKSYIGNFKRGDALELFFHTRFDAKSAVHNLFCHHFLFLPDYEGVPIAKEITSWRGGHTRPHASKGDLMLHREFQDNGYSLDIQIDANALHGFDLKEYQNLGFFYRLHTCKGRQTFFVGERANLDYAVSLWPDCRIFS